MSEIVDRIARGVLEVTPYRGAPYSRVIDVAFPSAEGAARLATDGRIARALADQRLADNSALYGPAPNVNALVLGDLPPATTPFLAAVATEVAELRGRDGVPMLPAIGYQVAPPEKAAWGGTVSPSTATGPPQAMVSAGVGLSDQLLDLTVLGPLLDRLLAYAVDEGCEEVALDTLAAQAPANANLLTAIGAARPLADLVVANPADLGPVSTALHDRPENFGVRHVASPGMAAATVLAVASGGVLVQTNPRQYGRTRQVGILETEAACWRSVLAGAFLPGAVQRAPVT
jgi:hypothetical protein